MQPPVSSNSNGKKKDTTGKSSFSAKSMKKISLLDDSSDEGNVLVQLFGLTLIECSVWNLNFSEIVKSTEIFEKIPRIS